MVKTICTVGPSGYDVGDIIVRQNPILVVIKDDMRSKVCNSCLKDTQLQCCSKCQFYYYCSEKCFDGKINHITEECKFIKKFKCENFLIKYATFKIYRLTQSDKINELKELVKQIGLTDVEPAQQYSLYKIDSRDFKDVSGDLMNETMRSLSLFLGKFGEKFNQILIGQVLRLFYFNRISIKFVLSKGNIDQETRTVAYGLYPDTPVMSHSCIPSCALWFKETTLSVRALIKLKENDHVTICLTNVLSNNNFRKITLQTNYHYECKCYRCKPGDRKLIEKDDCWLGSNEGKEKIIDFSDATWSQFSELYAQFRKELGYEKIPHEKTYPEPIYLKELPDVVADKKGRIQEVGSWIMGRIVKELPLKKCSPRCMKGQFRVPH